MTTTDQAQEISQRLGTVETYLNDQVATKEGLAALEAKVDELAAGQAAIRKHLDDLAAGQSNLGAGIIVIRDQLAVNQAALAAGQDAIRKHLGV